MSISESLPSTKISGEGMDGSSRGGTGSGRSNGGEDKSSHGGTRSGRGVTGAHGGAQRKGKSVRERELERRGKHEVEEARTRSR